MILYIAIFQVKQQLAEKHGIQDQWPVACETFAQWVIEVRELRDYVNPSLHSENQDTDLLSERGVCCLTQQQSCAGFQDNFAEGIAGRPKWEEVGVQIVDDVTPYELAKIRMLNVVGASYLTTHAIPFLTIH